MAAFDDLRDFHAAVGWTPPQVPTRPDSATLELRRTLIREECAEVMAEFEALEAAPGDDPLALAPLMHELADLLYVVYGSFVACGVDADAVFAEVHRANLHKASGPRRADGKVLKPEGFVPADVRSVLERLSAPAEPR